MAWFFYGRKKTPSTSDALERTTTLNQEEVFFTPEFELDPSLIRTFEHPLTEPGQELAREKEKTLKSLLGSKGFYLAEMTQVGLPVPPGFTITTKAARAILEEEKISDSLWYHILFGVNYLEQKTGKKLGDSVNPLIYSLRSGAKFSMPGMMSTALNVGITDKTLPGLINQIGEIPALDSYQRLIRMYSVAVYGISHQKFKEIDEEVLEKHQQKNKEYYEDLIKGFKGVIQFRAGVEDFEQDPQEQLRQGIIAIFRSWMSLSAINYRNLKGLPHDAWTACNVQAMVFGNSGEDSGTAVICTYDKNTGENEITGEFLFNAQGEEVVAGIAHPLPINQLPPEILTKLIPYLPEIEQLIKDAVDVEITWEKGKLYLLQARSLKTSSQAAVEIVADLARKGIISEKEALDRLGFEQIMGVKKPRFEENSLQKAREENRLIYQGIPVGGASAGQICLDPKRARELVEQGKKVCLICDHFDPNDVDLIPKLDAIITRRGGSSSHMGLIISESGLAGVMGCSDIDIIQDKRSIIINDQVHQEGIVVSVSGKTGEVFLGEIPITQAPDLSEKALRMIEKWEVVNGVDNPWAAFLFPEDLEELDHFSRLEAYRDAYEKAVNEWPGLHKAQQVCFLTHILPLSIKIPEVIVNADDTQGIRQAILQAKVRGLSVYPRSDNGKLLSPYVGSDLGLRDEGGEALQDWLQNPNSSCSRWGGLRHWNEKEDVQTVIVPFDPPDKLSKDPGIARQHFVCTLQCLSTSPPKVVVEIHDQTSHLRSIERIDKNQLMLVEAVANSQTENYLGQVNLKFGVAHYDREGIKKLATAFVQGNVNPQAQALRKKIIREFGQEDLKELTEEKLVRMLQGLMDKNLLTPNDCQLFINPRSFAVSNLVKEKILGQWWKEHGLPHLMWAVREITGARVLEIQGRLDPEGDSWLLIYGTKGEEEKALLQAEKLQG